MTAPERLTRVLASPGVRLAAGAAVVGAALLAAAPGPLAGAAGRAALILAGLAALAAFARGRAAQPHPAIAVIARAALARDAGIALVALEGRRLVVGYGSGGTRLLAALDEVAPAKPAKEVRP